MITRVCDRRENMRMKTWRNSTITAGVGEIPAGVFNGTLRTAFLGMKTSEMSHAGRGFASDEEEAPRPLWATLAKFA